MSDEIPDYVVLSHHHHEEAGVYRVVIGKPIVGTLYVMEDDGETPVMDEVPLLDDDGKPVVAPRPVLDARGEPVLTEDETPVQEDQPVVNLVHRSVEGVVDHAVVEDFLFAAHDKRWKGKSPEYIAREQQKIVAKALAQREKDAAKAAASASPAKEMPGSGEPLLHDGW